MTITIYGISTCATCNKAVKALSEADKSVTFRDVRAEPLSETELNDLIAQFGDNLVDRNSTVWRGLNDWMKHSEIEQQIAAHPKLMQRPVIRDGDRYYLGWTDAIQSALLD